MCLGSLRLSVPLLSNQNIAAIYGNIHSVYTFITLGPWHNDAMQFCRWLFQINFVLVFWLHLLLYFECIFNKFVPNVPIKNKPGLVKEQNYCTVYPLNMHGVLKSLFGDDCINSASWMHVICVNISCEVSSLALLRELTSRLIHLPIIAVLYKDGQMFPFENRSTDSIVKAHTQRSCRGVYLFHIIRLSVCLSVRR